MGIFDIGWIELFQVDNCPWNEMMKFQRVDGKWNINCLVELEMTSRSKMNCSFKKIVWSVNEYHPIPWHIENRKCESTLRAQYHAKRGHCSLIQTYIRWRIRRLEHSALRDPTHVDVKYEHQHHLGRLRNQKLVGPAPLSVIKLKAGEKVGFSTVCSNWIKGGTFRTNLTKSKTGENQQQKTAQNSTVQVFRVP